MAAVKEMTIEDKLKSLYHLQKIHSKLDEFAVLKGELPMEVSDLEDEIEGLKTRMSNLNDQIEDLKNSIAANHLAKKDAQELKLRYEKQLDNVKNNREYDALNKEIELQNLEEKLLDKRNDESEKEIENKEVLKKESEEFIHEKQQVLEEKKKELDVIIKDTEKEENELKANADGAKDGIDERLIKAFDRIRKTYSNGLAVVAYERDSCGGCFAKIPPQRQMEIRQRKKVIVCEHCGRIMIDPDIQNEDN